MDKIFVFAGTTEGRDIVSKLLDFNVEVTAFVATEYGSTLISKNATVINKRLDYDEMCKFFNKHKPKFVIDATHPYALVVTENIKNACKSTNFPYIRLLRESISLDFGVVVDDILKASLEINKHSGNVLVTTGSKELDILYENVIDKSRLFARVLPTKEVLDKCHSMNINTKNIIAMQGPFSTELNIAMCKALDIKIILSKDGGKVGGFDSKIECAKALGLKLITIGRKSSDIGLSLDEVFDKVTNNLTKKINNSLPFPLFTNISNKEILVVGGGKIAERRINTLKKFTKNITCVSKEFTESIKISDITLINRAFLNEDLQNKFMCITCTDDISLNEKIAYLCKEQNIHHSIASNKNLCSFYFPGIVLEDDIVIGICGDGNDHKKTKKKILELRGEQFEN